MAARERHAEPYTAAVADGAEYVLVADGEMRLHLDRVVYALPHDDFLRVGDDGERAHAKRDEEWEDRATSWESHERAAGATRAPRP